LGLKSAKNHKKFRLSNEVWKFTVATVPLNIINQTNL
jgi:hypothetical protein